VSAFQNRSYIGRWAVFEDEIIALRLWLRTATIPKGT